MFTLHQKDGIEFYTADTLENTGLVRAIFTTRIGGVSKGDFAAMNFGFSQEGAETVMENYRRICGCTGLDVSKLIYTKQTHSNNVYPVFRDSKPVENYDALVTNVKGMVLSTLHADCVPIYLLDTKNRAVAMIHAGWRGVYNNIIKSTIEKMKSEYASSPCAMLAAIGPSIGQCHFEVGQDLADDFANRYGSDIVSKQGTPHVDLWAACKKQLNVEGVTNIDIANLCTHCSKDKFYSHRRDNGKTGRMTGIISLL